MNVFVLDSGKLTLSNIKKLLKDPLKIILNPDNYHAINKAAAYLSKISNSEDTIYGINTGFGHLASSKISHENLKQLQKNLVLSHATGTGPFLDKNIVRLILLLKINSLAQGYSGVRAAIVDTLILFFNKQLYPCIPSKGSVGASGDLAPLAHLSAALLGEGEVVYEDKTLTAQEGLAKLNTKPLDLGPKEGLALLNGTQVSTAIALYHYLTIEKLLYAAVAIGSLTTEAIHGNHAPFDENIHAIRGQQGQQEIASYYRKLLTDNPIHQATLSSHRVQDPYSIRCQPQVMGACLDYLHFCADIFLREANGVSDNPLIFAEESTILSGGNFHAQPIAMAADALALCVAEIGALAERRIALLMDKNFSGLPPFLVQESGVNSGFMIAHVTAAALASENKSLAHPASVDSIPTSANQEDHVSMATFAARRLGEMADNTATILAIELLAACQGIEFHRPLRCSDKLEKIIADLRTQVPFYEKDRFFAPDIAKAKTFLLEYDWNLFDP